MGQRKPCFGAKEMEADVLDAQVSLLEKEEQINLIANY